MGTSANQRYRSGMSPLARVHDVAAMRHPWDFVSARKMRGQLTPLPIAARREFDPCFLSAHPLSALCAVNRPLNTQDDRQCHDNITKGHQQLTAGTLQLTISKV